jgi:hypothetical protein
VPFQFLTRLFSKKLNAAQAYSQAGGSAQHAFWLFAHPVHLVLARDHFVLSEPAPVLASRADTESIILSLNQHFLPQKLHFYAIENDWFLGLDADPKITTTALKHALNKDITPYLPQGEGALVWAKLQNEIQMLLFNHPINEAREARGELPINSVWFDGLSAA